MRNRDAQGTQGAPGTDEQCEHEEESSGTDGPSSSLQKWKAAAGALALGILGSAIWEMIARPSLGGVGRFLLTVFSLGTEALRNYAYTEAAMDPQAIPALLVLVIVTPVATYPAASFLSYLLPSRRRNEHEQIDVPGNAEPHSVERLERELGRIKTKLSRARMGVKAVGLVTGVFGVVGVLVVNQAILINRIFNANLAICAPYMDLKAEEQLRGYPSRPMARLAV